tara:strand:- start:97 stop:663 length:567 start_codon:yes stop_codon:yes gene_type:complete
MGTFTITLSGNINESLSVGDAIYTAGKVNALDAGTTASVSSAIGTEITLTAPNNQIIPGLTVTGTGISNTVTVASISGEDLVLSGAPGGTPSGTLTFSGADSGIDKNNSSNLPILRGTVTGINNTTNVITVDDGGTAITGNQLANAMALFAKSGVVNTSGISGYYAKIKMKNTSTTEAKLFSVGSEVV